MKKYLLLFVGLVILTPTLVFGQSSNEKINLLLEEIAVLEKEAEGKRQELRALAFEPYTGQTDFITIGEDVTQDDSVSTELVTLEQIVMDYSEEYPKLIEIYSFKNLSDKSIEFWISESGIAWSRKLEPLENDAGHYVLNETEYVIPDGTGFVKSNSEPKELLPQQEVFFRVTSKIEEPLGVYYLSDRSGYWKVPIHNTPEPFGEFIRQ